MENQVHTFTTIQSMVAENSFGIVAEQENVTLHVSVGINSDTYGWFEIYDEETGGGDWYAEGSLTFDNKELVGYDGVFSLASFVMDKLEEVGINVTYMRETLQD